MIGKIIELAVLCGLASIASAQGSEPINQKTPYCNFNNGIKMTMDSNDKLLLPFTVSWADVTPHFVLGKWTCFYRGQDKQKLVCPEAQQNIILAYEKGFNSGNFTIAADTFQPDDTVTLHLTISELKTNVQYLCGINIKVQPEGIENIPVVLHSDVAFNTHITMEDKHQFSCDIDWGNIDAVAIELKEKKVKYEARLYDLRDESNEPQAQYNSHENAMLVQPDYFEPNKVYVFRCEVNYEDQGTTHNGVAWKLYNTRQSVNQPVFTVSPDHGTPFVTQFTLKVDKEPALTKLKCEFGYTNSVGKVVLPTPDTGDYLQQSQKFASQQPFNTDSLTLVTAFPPNSPSSLQDEIMVLTCQCWNQYGQAKILKQVITLDNSKIKVNDQIIMSLQEQESYDLNSILLVADAFVTTRQGFNSIQQPYKNNDLMRKAIRKITKDIMQIETDSMDMHKTKQLAWVMYILTERSLNEDTWEGQEDQKEVVADMVTAVTNLIMANQFSPTDAQSSLSGTKNTIPLDMEGFEWLAKTADNLILHSMLLVPPENEQAIKLKTDFFRFGLYRLAGGMDNSQLDDPNPIRGVRTQSFTIELMKFSAANMIDIPIEFNIESTAMQDNMHQKGNVTVELPPDRTMFSGQNILVGVMYSAQTGEETVNYMEHSQDDYQLEFLGGIVKIEVASTPQAFGTDKVCQVWDKEVKNLEQPVVIKLPVQHDEMKNLSAERLIKAGLVCAYSQDWEADWQPLNQKCPQSYYDQLGIEEFVCCSDHLTSFSVGRKIDATGGHLGAAAIPLSGINVLLVIGLVFGIILDFAGVLTVDPKGKEEQVHLPQKGGAAQEEQVANDNVQQQNPPDKGEVGPEDIQVNINAQPEPASSSAPKSQEEEQSDIFGNKLGFCKAYCNTFRYFHRIGNIFFSCSYKQSRPVKVMNTCAQLTMTIAIACGVIAASGTSAFDMDIAALCIASLVMRFVQPLFNFMESAIGRSSKSGNVICFLFFFGVTAGMEAIIGVSLYQPTRDENVRKSMAEAASMCLVFELVYWDTILMPILLGVFASACNCCEKSLNVLKLPVPHCKC